MNLSDDEKALACAEAFKPLRMGHLRSPSDFTGCDDCLQLATGRRFCTMNCSGVPNSEKAYQW